MSPYRQSGVPEQPPPRPTVFDVIELAWARCSDRKTALVGNRPSRWRVFAHARWKKRVHEYAFMVPTRADLVEAAEELGANHLKVTLMSAYARVHGHPGRSR